MATFSISFLVSKGPTTRKVSEQMLFSSPSSGSPITFALTGSPTKPAAPSALEMKTLKKLNLVSYKLDKLLEKSGISVSDELSKDLEDVHTDLLAQKLKKIKNK